MKSRLRCCLRFNDWVKTLVIEVKCSLPIRIWLFFQLTYRRSIDALYRLMKDPYVLPGGGCLEAALYRSLMAVSDYDKTC